MRTKITVLSGLALTALGVFEPVLGAIHFMH